ncbi:MAG: hypothetical protein C0514_01095 [Candidatus Puniceispirillum sp.]|nr:hypothetical protein [Candidatus Puniceispirillum sp.]
MLSSWSLAKVVALKPRQGATIKKTARVILNSRILHNKTVQNQHAPLIFNYILTVKTLSNRSDLTFSWNALKLRSFYVAILTAFLTFQAYTSDDQDSPPRPVGTNPSPARTIELGDLTSSAPMTGQEILFTLYVQKLPRPVLSHIFSYLDEASLFNLCAAQLPFQFMDEERVNTFSQASQALIRRVRTSDAVATVLGSRVPIYRMDQELVSHGSCPEDLLTTLHAALKHPSSYCEMSLHDAKWRKLALVPLAVALSKNTRGETLSLDFFWFESQSIGVFTGALCHNRTLVNLDLSFNPLRDEGLKTLLGALSHIPLKKLALFQTLLTHESAALIGHFVQNKKTLTHLNAAGNDLGDEGMDALAPALVGNASLHSLKIGDNGITSKGAAALAVALRDNTVLTFLGLPHNKIDSKGALVLCEMTQDTLTLDLFYNPSIDSKFLAQLAKIRGKVDYSQKATNSAAWS